MRSHKSVVTTAVSAKYVVRHVAGADDRPICGQPGTFKRLTPGQEPLFDLCARCAATELGRKPRAETRPSRAKANTR